MIQHLLWLTRPTPGVAPGALAVAVYAEPRGNGDYQYRAAQESGYEGVACLDDVARAADLCCRIWRYSGNQRVAQYARGYLAFVRGMQANDGRFSNFIFDWSGARNTGGPTSFTGGGWWTVRALIALATGYATFHDRVDARAFRHGLQWLRSDRLSASQSALGILAAHEFWRVTGDTSMLRIIAELAEHVALHRHGVALVDEGESDPMHLWGRYHEIALLNAARALGRPDFLSAALSSADAVLVPAAISLATRTPTLPYEASCVARALFCLSAETGSRMHRALAFLTAAWFTGRNAANIPVFDSVAGRFYDGIDPGPRRSHNAGAESNIEGPLTLLTLSSSHCIEWSSGDHRRPT